jgi:hypothetical protein
MGKLSRGPEEDEASSDDKPILSFPTLAIDQSLSDIHIGW